MNQKYIAGVLRGHERALLCCQFLPSVAPVCITQWTDAALMDWGASATDAAAYRTAQVVLEYFSSESGQGPVPSSDLIRRFVKDFVSTRMLSGLMWLISWEELSSWLMSNVQPS